MLAEFYTSLVEELDASIEIIFVSSDQDDAQFQGYFAEHPWTALPFSHRDIAQALGSKFGVRGIPALVILNGADGSVRDPNGRNTVSAASNDPSKCKSAWHC